ncbi:unnamed protein product [Brassica napus]|uniref:(rape) hypothetical protein n=1 Tax=Brassica napus TaxID=3708 RepID=A0A816I6A9_BRANA|nr:unnamed protein product [Brassica napus]
MANVWSSSSICRRAAIPPLLEPAAVSEKPEIFAVVESLWERICSFWILRRFGYAGALVSVAIGKSAIAVDLISCHSWKLKLVESTLKSVLLDAHRCLSKFTWSIQTGNISRFASHLCPLPFPFSVAESTNTHLQDELMEFYNAKRRER